MGAEEEDLGDLNAADLVDLLRDDPSGVDEIEAAERAREGGPRKTVLAAIERARGSSSDEPEGGGEAGLLTAAPPADAQEGSSEEGGPEPEGSAADPDEVTFVCDQWAGVSLYGRGIKFNDHRFTTSDPSKIAALDAWEHARRET